MPFDLWGATDSLGLNLPNRPLGYFLLFIYGVVFVALVYWRRADLRRLSNKKWLATFALSLVSLLFSQLFPITITLNNQLSPLSVTQNPVTTLTLLTTFPFLLAAVALNPTAALIVGLFAGLGRALGQTHQLFDIFHVAFAAILAAYWLRQKYQGKVYDWLRQPIVSGGLSYAATFGLVGLAAFATTHAEATYLSALDLAISTANANFWPLLVEGVFGGALVWLLLQGLPQLRPLPTLVPSPQQRSLTRRLMSNFVLFAVLLVIVLVTVVFTLAIRVSTQLVVNQMAHNTNTVSNEEIPAFRARLESLLVEYSLDEALVSADAEETTKALRQLHRTSPVYRRVLLVGDDESIDFFFPQDGLPVALTESEQTAVAATLANNTSSITTAQSVGDEYVISFVVPVLGQDGRPTAALIGRVPELSLKSLIVGLQGTVGQGEGFIVDERSRIIAHGDSSQLLTNWLPPNPPPRPIATTGDLPGVAYEGRDEQSNARELVYYVRSLNPGWTVVTTVPYEVVLDLALGIGAPLALVLLLITAVFYANFVFLGRDITAPISELVQASKTVAAGGSFSTDIHNQRHDELGQLSLAFTQMQRALKQRVDELSLLLSVSDDVSRNVDLQQGMPMILQGVLRGTGASGARAVIVNPNGQRPLQFGEGPTASLMASLDRVIMTNVRHTQTFTLSTPSDIRRQLGLPDHEPLPVPALMAIPLHAHDRFQGILWLGYRQNHTFSQSETDLLHTLARQTSILVENAHLFSRVDGGRRRLTAVLTSTSDAVIVTDQTDRILLINPAFENVFKLKSADVIGRAVTDVITIRPLAEALTYEDKRPRKLEIDSDDGRTYYTSASPIISNEGQALGRVAVLHDVTHFKEIDEMKSDFVSTVSHDLRSPLTYMRGYATMLSMAGELNDQQDKYVAKILSGIDQMAMLVNNLLDLGRIEAGIELMMEDINLRLLLEEIAEEHWQHAHLMGIKLQVEAPETIPPIQGDRALIRQAVTNLISNGLKYAPDSGPMTIKAERLNGEVIVSVKDNGPGIDEKDQMRLFEKFYRVKRRGTEKIKGSGLGLAIVRSIAERHGGRAWCNSEAGKGSTFFVSLPIEPRTNVNGVMPSIR